MNFVKYIQTNEINLLNFNLLISEKIKQRRFFLLMYEFDYSKNYKNLKIIKKSNQLFFFEYLNSCFKKLINYFFKNYFNLLINTSYSYLSLPIILTSELFQYIYRKIYLYLYQKFRIFLFFKRLYLFLKRKKRMKKKLMILVNFINKKYFNNFNFSNSQLINLLDYLFKNFLPIFSFENLIVRLNRIFLLTKLLSNVNSLSFLGYFFVDEFFFWFYSNYYTVNLKFYWKYLIKVSNQVYFEEMFIYKNKYELFQIYSKNNLHEAYFFLTNKLLEKELKNQLIIIPKFHKYKNFFSEFIKYFGIVLLITFSLLDLSGFNTTFLSQLVLYWQIFDPTRYKTEQDWVLFLNPYKHGENLLAREYFNFFFDFWGIF
jgi:hypothetical protein